MNCKSQDKFIDQIIKLSEDLQTTLMEIAKKYIQKEEPPEVDESNKMVESLAKQLDAREEEKNSLLMQLRKEEEEKSLLARELEELKGKHNGVLKEFDAAKQELEKLRKKSDESIYWIQREKELEAEVATLSQEIETLNKKSADAEKAKDEELTKTKEELFIAQQKMKKISATETLLEQQKKKCEELMNANQNMAEESNRVAVLEGRIAALENGKKSLEEKNIELINEVYSGKSTMQNSESEIKKLIAENSRLEKEGRKAEERSKQQEQKSTSQLEELAALRKEYDSLKIAAGAGNLLSQEKEANYQGEIEKLKAQVARLAEGSGETLKAYTLELEDKLNVLTNEKQKQGQEMILLSKHQSDLEGENEQLKTQLEYFTKSNADASEQAKEYQQLRFERDELQRQVKEASGKLQTMELQRVEDEKAKKELELTKVDIEKLRKDKEECDSLIKNLREVNMDLEKKYARDEEKISLMTEERSKLDFLLKDSSKKLEVDYSSRLGGETEKLKQSLKEKYKSKTEAIKEELKAKQKLLAEYEKEIRSKDLQLEDLEGRLTAEYEANLKEVKEKCEVEKQTAKKALKDLHESYRKEERLLSSALYEMGSVINKIMRENKKEAPGGPMQQLLGRMAEGMRKADVGTSGFISAQAEARAQSNALKP